MTPEEIRAARFLLGVGETPESVRANGDANPDLADWCERMAGNMDELKGTL